MNEIITKKCEKCKKRKGADEFYNNSSKKDGKTSWCKSCISEQPRKKPVLSEQSVQRNKDRCKRWYSKNKEKAKEYARAAYQNNKSKFKLRAKKWKAEHKEKAIESSRKYYEKNKEVCLARSSSWGKRNKEKVRAYCENRRSRKKFNGDCISSKELSELLEKYGNKCLKCGATNNIEFDHVIPLSVGGRHTIDNIQPLCRSCNAHKWTRIEDYRNKDNL